MLYRPLVLLILIIWLNLLMFKIFLRDMWIRIWICIWTSFIGRSRFIYIFGFLLFSNFIRLKWIILHHFFLYNLATTKWIIIYSLLLFILLIIMMTISLKFFLSRLNFLFRPFTLIIFLILIIIRRDIFIWILIILRVLFILLDQDILFLFD